MFDIKSMIIIDMETFDEMSSNWLELAANIASEALINYGEGLVSEQIASINVDNSILGETGTDILRSTSMALASSLIGAPPEPKYFIFRINPNNLRNTESKLMTVTEYGRDKQDIEVWGNKLTSYEYSASTGSLVPDPVFLNNGITDIRLSKAWQNFEKFKSFYLQKNKKLLILFEQEAVQGVFTNFSFNRDANDPWQIKYSFSLLVDSSTRRNIISGVFDSVIGKWNVSNLVNGFINDRKFTKTWSNKIGLHKVVNKVTSNII